MDRIKEASSVIADLNLYQKGMQDEHLFVRKICTHFDKVKDQSLSPSDFQFLKYISNMAGVPHYYDLLFDKFGHEDDHNVDSLSTLSSLIYEDTLYVDESTKLHKYQKSVLEEFKEDKKNRIFLSATTSFGKTFLIYEVIKKMNYSNVALIFPTIALLSENYERILSNKNYSYFHDNYKIHTLSDSDESSEKNIYIFTPERFLSFLDRRKDIQLDFVFVDEVYKIDSDRMIDTIHKENERDMSYRIALRHMLDMSDDILLVGPYIRLQSSDNDGGTSSFNTFLNSYGFNIIDFNELDIVSKTSNVIRNGLFRIDEHLTIDLKGYSKKTQGQRISKVIEDIRSIKDNVIVYTKGPATAENHARKIIENSILDEGINSERLLSFVQHLVERFEYDDWIIIEALKHRIGVHHGLVPKYIQKEIVSMFNDGDIDVLISTTTITEGVNTSAKNLVVTSAKKGNSHLQSFDAKNIAGRAGRFLHHYSGRVLILDKAFKSILDGEAEELRHKNFDQESTKNEVDYFITDDDYLSKTDVEEKARIIREQRKREIPDEIMSMFKVISHTDKIYIYDKILSLTSVQHRMIRSLVSGLNFNMFLDLNGFKLVVSLVKDIITNSGLKFLIERESVVRRGDNAGRSYPVICFMLSSYLSGGFSDCVKYNLTRFEPNGEKYTTDKAMRESSRFIFNTLKYQLVKYLGVFNLMYKYERSRALDKPMDKISGLDVLLLKLEYNATTEKGRLASDYGVPSKIVDYYESDEKPEIRLKFDEFEEDKFLKIEQMISEDQSDS